MFQVLLILSGWEVCGQESGELTFSFGKEAITKNEIPAVVDWPCNKDGQTFGLTGDYEIEEEYLTSESSFAFWLKVPEGNYEISVVLGDGKHTTNTTIRAESRRLMIYDHTTSGGLIDTVKFMVNIRSARINETDSIRLKSREFAYLNWDHNLTLEFAGNKPCLRSITIRKAPSVPTIFLVGNSTVVDQEKEPWASWGQIFPAFLKHSVAVANFAESGESLKSFIRAGRFAKIASLIQPGDYLFMEFAHNDQKPGANHVEPYTSYTEHLMKFVNLARAHKATPVLVTSTHRRKFDKRGNIVNTLEEYPDAMRMLARKESIPLIDLNAMSRELFEALGPEKSKKAFVHYEAGTFDWQPEALADNTHFSTYGAWQLAKCVSKALKKTIPALTPHLQYDIDEYDPRHPDPYEVWKWPLSQNGSVTKPEGS